MKWKQVPKIFLLVGFSNASFKIHSYQGSNVSEVYQYKLKDLEQLFFSPPTGLASKNLVLQVVSRVSTQWISCCRIVVFFLYGAWFMLNGNVRSLYNRYWCYKNPCEVCEIPLHDLKFGVWCANQTAEAMYSKETINVFQIVSSEITSFESMWLLCLGVWVTESCEHSTYSARVKR